MMMIQSSIREDFLKAMAQFAAGVTAVATLDHDPHTGQERPIGLIATAVSSLSADPATLLVCINKTASAHRAMLDARRFSVNLLASDQQAVAERFAQHKGSARFVSDEWTSLITGVPVLRGAAASFDCELLEAHDGYSHTIIIVAVKAVATSSSDDPHCLLWYQRRFAKSAFF